MQDVAADDDSDDDDDDDINEDTVSQLHWK